MRRSSALLRPLAWFWGVVVVIAAVGGTTLQTLGPPRQAEMPEAPPVPATAAEPVTATHAASVVPAPRPVPAPIVPATRAAGAPIPPPDPALEEPVPGEAGIVLPKIAADGRQPMQAYAGGFDAADTRPRVALLLSDIGMSSRDSDDAVHGLPAAVSFAVSPYADRTAELLAAARTDGHELLVALPLEPPNYPLNDPGGLALMTGASATINAQHLDWTLARVRGVVGATGAMGRLHGERFAGSPEQMGPVLDELGARGLLYIDPRTAKPGANWSGSAAGRAVDLVVDEPALRKPIDDRLTQLEQLARDRGTALGLVDEPAPVTVARIAAWASGLTQRGVVLVPVSALARPAAAAR